MTAEEHNKYLSWTFLGNGLFQTALLILIYGLVTAIFLAEPPGNNFPFGIFAAFFFVIFLVNMAIISPNFIAYYALKNRKPWARVASIVAGVLSAMNVPVGTAACAYALWYFFGEEWKSVYPAEAMKQLPSHAQMPQKNWSGQYVREDGEVVYRPVNPPDWR